MRGSHSLCVVISIDLSAVQQSFPADFLSFALPPILTLYPLIVPPPPIHLSSVAAPQWSFNILLCLLCLTDLLAIVALMLLHTFTRTHLCTCNKLTTKTINLHSISGLRILLANKDHTHTSTPFLLFARKHTLFFKESLFTMGSSDCPHVEACNTLPSLLLLSLLVAVLQ